MAESPVLIVGAGLAGLCAATTLVQNGISTLIVDQSPAIGGNIHRQPRAGAKPIKLLKPQIKRWQRVSARLQAAQHKIDIRNQTRFAGLDYTGNALICGLQNNKSEMLKPAALIMATGAIERVQPRLGWTLPNVMTAGAIQTSLKTTGVAPKGKIILAGSGPLLLAIGAQLVKAGNPPLAIIEAGRPLAQPFKALGLPLTYLSEAMSYLASLHLARVPIYYGAQVTQITQTKQQKLQISFVRNAGKTHNLTADMIGLHDGLRSNDYEIDETIDIPIVKAGDCSQILGARAAELDGIRAGHEIANKLLNRAIHPTQDKLWFVQQKAQRILAEIYTHNGLKRLKTLPDETIICRCENRTRGALCISTQPTLRQARLNSRFGMGACQGRFCSEWVQHLLHQDPSTSDAKLTSQRWPLQPISISSLVDVKKT